VRKARVLTETKSDPWALYLYALKSPATKEKYLLRLGKFLDFADLKKSAGASKGIEGSSVYSATKVAIRSFTRTWIVDLKQRKIRVNHQSYAQWFGTEGEEPREHRASGTNGKT
jgi:NAD(P)-dependent dehydrogenase (short-subunit alcohol dehydrogenase family)